MSIITAKGIRKCYHLQLAYQFFFGKKISKKLHTLPAPFFFGVNKESTNLPLEIHFFASY